MILLKNNLGSCILDIQGYEFCRYNDKYDANWLVVSARFVEEDQMFRKPCLLTTELVEIKNRILKQLPWKSNFFEPDIEVKVEQNFVQFNLSYDLVENIQTNNPKIYEYIFDICDKSQKNILINSINDMIQNYPERDV